MKTKCYLLDSLCNRHEFMIGSKDEPKLFPYKNETRGEIWVDGVTIQFNNPVYLDEETEGRIMPGDGFALIEITKNLVEELNRSLDEICPSDRPTLELIVDEFGKTFDLEGFGRKVEEHFAEEN